MANKFTQSVLERQHQEAMEAKRRKPSPKTLEPIKEDVLQESTPTPSAPQQIEPETPEPFDLDAYLIKQTDRVAKNKTFYLDKVVIDAVKAAAKQQHVTDSKLVNDILLTVLVQNRKASKRH